MGKKVKKQEKTEEEQAEELEETKIQEIQPYESDFVKLKKENAKIFESKTKAMDLAVKGNVDMKQALSAIKALQKYFKKSSGKKNSLLENEDVPVHLNFTLTKVPSYAPSPRPL